MLATAFVSGGSALATAPEAAAATYPCSKNQTLRQGQKNSCVRALQVYLNGYSNARLTVDGIFGPATNTAVKNFQRKAKIGVDGIVGPQTRLAVCARTGIPINSGATFTQIKAAGTAVFDMCWGWGFYFD